MNKEIIMCPLCKGETFSQGDDFKLLCPKHSTKVISLLFCHMAREIVNSPKKGE